MATIREFVQRCDIGTTDAYTAGDAGASYVASIRTRPFLLAGLLNRAGVMVGSLLATAVTGLLNLRMIRDFGQETTENFVVDMASAQDIKITQVDDYRLSESIAVELEFEDGTTPVDWELHQFALKARAEETP